MTVRGRNLTKRKMTGEERKMYGLPLTGKAKLEAEMAGRWEERTVEGNAEEWELEATPNRAEFSWSQKEANGGNL